MSLYKILLIIILCVTQLQASSRSNSKGWLWYQDPVLPKEKIQKKHKKDIPFLSKVPSSKSLSAVDRLEVQKKAFAEAKALAILEPTLANVAKAQRHHNFIMAQASNFQKSWGIVEMLDPGYKKIVTSPGSLIIKEKQDEIEMTKKLKSLAKDFGLIFAFKTHCPYCHQFAPLVKKFASKYGFKLQGLSKTDECYEGMTCSKNASAVLAINPQGEYPMLYLANPKTNEVIPIARGYIGLDALMTNVKYALTYLKNEGQFS